MYGDSDISTEAAKKGSADMPIDDKMRMWAQKDSLDKPEAERGEVFEGVGDYDDGHDADVHDDVDNNEIASSDELQSYNEIILGSAAYDWLI